jgi:putative DNA primase/helicase
LADRRQDQSGLWQTEDKAAIQFKFATGKGKDRREQMILELRIGGGDKGAQTVFPGSVHETGELITWDEKEDIARTEGDSLKQQCARAASAALIAGHFPTKGARHDAGLTLGGFLFRCGFSRPDTGLFVEAVTVASGQPVEKVKDVKKAACESWDEANRQGGQARGFPALSETFGDDVAKHVAKWLGYQSDTAADKHPEAAVVPPMGFTEDALALTFAERHENELRYVAVWGKWIVWAGVYWKTETTLAVFDMARTIMRETARWFKEHGQPPPSHLAKAKTVSAIESLARSDRRLAATVEQWDANQLLLNTTDGAANLSNGAIAPNNLMDYCMKSTAIAPAAPGTRCPLWLSFLNKVMGENHELVAYLQRVCGYALTGSIKEHALFFLYGTGANGKTVFINTIRGIFGDYHTTAPIETFTVTNSAQHPTDLAGLMGARLVTAVETEEGRQWAEAKIKALTGGDEISARFMRQDFFTFTPVFKLMVAGNHKPRLRSVDEAIRRRLQMIPFDVTIPVDDRDKDLAEKLKAEWPAILRWMIDGCIKWQAKGLNPPQAVIAATNEYLESEDAISTWISDTCEIGPSKRAVNALLFASFRDWAEKNGEFAISQKALVSKLLLRHGIKKSPDTHMRGLLGIGLKTEPEPEFDPYDEP